MLFVPPELNHPNRLQEDLNNLQVDVLSARCIVHRLRSRRAEKQLAALASKEIVSKTLSDLQEVVAFVQEVQGHQRTTL